jgi:hypothetical protein
MFGRERRVATPSKGRTGVADRGAAHEPSPVRYRSVVGAVGDTLAWHGDSGLAASSDLV